MRIRVAMLSFQILIFAGDDGKVFSKISQCLERILPQNIYTITGLSSTSFLSYPWMDEKPVCLILAETSMLGDIAWGRVQAYFVNVIFRIKSSDLFREGRSFSYAKTDCWPASRIANPVKCSRTFWEARLGTVQLIRTSGRTSRGFWSGLSSR